jgi:hypothetical protein
MPCFCNSLSVYAAATALFASRDLYQLIYFRFSVATFASGLTLSMKASELISFSVSAGLNGAAMALTIRQCARLLPAFRVESLDGRANLVSELPPRDMRRWVATRPETHLEDPSMLSVVDD